MALAGVGDLQRYLDRRLFFVCSRVMMAEEVTVAIRGHWTIENVWHWIPDVTLGEDASRVAQGDVAENLSLMRSVVIAALKHVEA